MIMEKKIKIGLIGLVIIVVLTSVLFITTKKGTTLEPVSEEKEEENESWVIASDDELLGKYEKSDREFQRNDVGNFISYVHQRTIDGIIVDGDQIIYTFDKSTKELIDKTIHWQDDLPEHLPPVIPKEQAESIAGGGSATLRFVSPKFFVSPPEQAPKNPCWVVWKATGADEYGTYYDILIINAVEGKILGYGIPPP